MSMINWLADASDRSKHMPRRPMRAAARRLAAELARFPANDSGLQVDDQVRVVQQVIDSEELVYERKLSICYAIIAGLSIALIFVSALLVAIAWPL